MKISSEDLVKLLIQYPGKSIEASISTEYFRATHMFEWYGFTISDIGIDSQEIKWNPIDFLDFYPNALWLVELIV